MISKCLIINTVIIGFCLSNFVESGKTRSNGVVKTIKTEDGDYDCVDFYKQPAFNHPLLKNHSFHPEMRPSFVPKWIKEDDEVSNEVFMDIRFKGETCPRGMVPIRNHDEDDLLRQAQIRRHSYAQLGSSTTNYSNAWSPSKPHFAIGQSKSDITKVYNGISSTLSVFNPYMENTQYSSGEIIIKGGGDSITTGWTVNPMVYRDSQTRFFIYTVSGESHCFNSRCGFIQVRSDIPLDFLIKPTSTVEGPKYVFPFFVYQDKLNGNWWLRVSPQDLTIGFWPQKFFKGLYKSGEYIACGGEVYGPPELGNPKMGSGYKPKSRDPEWSYCRNLNYLDEAHNPVLDTNLEPYSNNGHYYDVYVYDNADKHYVLYGGPERY